MVAFIVIGNANITRIRRVFHEPAAAVPLLFIRHRRRFKRNSLIRPRLSESIVRFVFRLKRGPELLGHALAGIGHAVASARHSVSATANCAVNHDKTPPPRLIAGVFAERFPESALLLPIHFRRQRRRNRIAGILMLQLCFPRISDELIRMLFRPALGKTLVCILVADYETRFRVKLQDAAKPRTERIEIPCAVRTLIFKPIETLNSVKMQSHRRALADNRLACRIRYHFTLHHRVRRECLAVRFDSRQKPAIDNLRIGRFRLCRQFRRRKSAAAVFHEVAVLGILFRRRHLFHDIAVASPRNHIRSAMFVRRKPCGIIKTQFFPTFTQYARRFCFFCR